MKYCNKGKSYEVESVVCGGTIINVNGTSITDQRAMSVIMGYPHNEESWSVFVEGDELAFDTFAEAYEYATTKQKNTCRLA